MAPDDATGLAALVALLAAMARVPAAANRIPATAEDGQR
jgi:hypothetical protein